MEKQVPLPRVLLQQNTIPRYREGLYRQLKNLSCVELEFVADLQSDTPFMAVTDKERADHLGVIQAKTFLLRLHRRVQLAWQPMAVKMAWQREYDSIIALGSPYSLTTWALLLLGLHKGIPVFLWTHGLLEDEEGMKWAIRRLQFDLSRGLLLYGDRAATLLVQKGIPRHKIHVVYNSLDSEEQDRVQSEVVHFDESQIRREFKVEGAERVLIFVGRLQTVKKLELIVSLVSQLTKRSRNVHAIFIGEGEERLNLEALCQRESVSDKVHFLGSSHDEKFIGRAFSISDLCVIPSGAGLAVMHSLAYGTPVVTHDNEADQFPEVEAVIPGITGFYYQQDQLKDLVNTVEAALYPRSSKAQMSEACMNLIRDRYSLESHADRIATAVLKTLGRAKEGSPVEKSL